MKGILLNNRYQIKDVIGVGGMAYVYEAYDTVLERNVAIKILRDQFNDNEEVINKLKAEATSSASIVDENIVSIFDVGSTEIDGKIVDYIVMEKINGRTLKDIIEEEAPLSEDRILYYAKQIAKALQTAHRHGLVHRDIKPANILITEDDKVKVVDFGIAHVSSEATITYTSSILGTVHYISPEQAKGHSIDSRSDLYSFGIVLYEMATGKVPFDGDTPVSIAIKHIQETPVPIRNLNPGISESLVIIIRNLLAKDIENRYKTASNLIIDIDKCIQRREVKKLDDTEKFENVDINSKQVKYSTKKEMIEDKSDKNRISRIGIIFYAILVLVSMGFIYVLANGFESGGKTSEERIEVPNVIEFEEKDAITKLENLGLKAEIEAREYDDRIKENQVINQSIKYNTEVKKGTIVKLVISKGREKVEVPNLIGLDYQIVEKYLKDNYLEVGSLKKKHDDKPLNQVIEQNPEKGEMVVKGSKVDITISLGPKEEPVIVPNVKGLTQSKALETLINSGLNPTNITQEHSDDVKENHVISQSIAAGTKVKKDSDISIIISLGKANKQEPNPPKEEDDNSKKPEKPKDDENKVKDKEFTFKLNLPLNMEDDKFKVEIININDKKVLLSKEYNKKDAVEGYILVKLKAPSDAVFEVYYDGKLTTTNHE